MKTLSWEILFEGDDCVRSYQERQMNFYEFEETPLMKFENSLFVIYDLKVLYWHSGGNDGGNFMQGHGGLITAGEFIKWDS